jgi:hypothetical protein
MRSHTIAIDVMITIFFDFRQFCAKNGVFLKNQCYDSNFAKTSNKNANFLAIFSRNYFTSHEIATWMIFRGGVAAGSVCRVRSALLVFVGRARRRGRRKFDVKHFAVDA